MKKYAFLLVKVKYSQKYQQDILILFCFNTYLEVISGKTGLSNCPLLLRVNSSYKPDEWALLQLTLRGVFDLHTHTLVCFPDDRKHHKQHSSAVFSHLWAKRISFFTSASIIHVFLKKLHDEEWTAIYFQIYRWTLKSVILMVYIHSCLIRNKSSILIRADKNHKTALKNGSKVLLILGVNLVTMKAGI